MLPPEKKISFKIITGIILFTMVFSIVSPVLLSPKPASAQMVVTDPPLLGFFVGKSIADKAQTILQQVRDALSALLFKNVIGYITQELAKYAANYIISGGKAQKPAFFTNPGKFFGNLAANVAMDTVNNLVKEWTNGAFDLCTPIDPNFKLTMLLNIAPFDVSDKYHLPQPECSVGKMMRAMRETWNNVKRFDLTNIVDVQLATGPTAQYRQGLGDNFNNILNQLPGLNPALRGSIRTIIENDVAKLGEIQDRYATAMNGVAEVLDRPRREAEARGETLTEENLLSLLTEEDRTSLEEYKSEINQILADLRDHAQGEARGETNRLKEKSIGCLSAYRTAVERYNQALQSFRTDPTGTPPEKPLCNITFNNSPCWSTFLNVASCSEAEWDTGPFYFPQGENKKSSISGLENKVICPDLSPSQPQRTICTKCCSERFYGLQDSMEKGIQATTRYTAMILDWHSRLEQMMTTSLVNITEGADNIGSNFVSLGDVRRMMAPEGNDFSTALHVQARSLQTVAAAVEQSKFFRSIQGGMNAVTSTISGMVRTPAELIRNQTEGAFNKSGSKELQYTGQAVADSVQLFINILMNHLMQMALKGLLNPQLDPDYASLKGLNMPSIAGANLLTKTKSLTNTSRPGISQGEAILSSVFTSSPKSFSGSINILNDFALCPDQYAGPNNCVVEEGFLLAAQQQLTVAEAIEKGILHGDWFLIPPANTEKNQDLKCFSYAYCYSNLVKLRRASILPIGWEIAADKSTGAITLKDAIENFNNSKSPFYHLIDPNWVIKAPVAQCRAIVYSELLQAKNSQNRLETCVDMPTCINEKEDGNCGGVWGYCVKQKNIWRFHGEECPKYYNTCQVFTRAEDSQNFSYLKNTLNFEGCDSDTAKGCQWYCHRWNTDKNRWDCYWNENLNQYESVDNPLFSAEQIYFNKNVKSCEAADLGCHEFLGLKEVERGKAEEIFDGVSKGLSQTYPETVQKIYLKKAPDYLKCYDEDPSNDAPECANFSAKCSQDEVGCEKYTPASGGPALAGLVGNYDTCPAECAGYKYYKEMPTNFEFGRDPVALISKTAATCPASDAGCEEFTNLDTVAAGGEGLEYYTYIRQCQKPAQNCGVFYTWVGSDVSGYQLKVYNLKKDGNNPNEPAEVENPSSGKCETEADAAADPDCKEFYAPDGSVSYHLIKNTITCSEDCHSLRKSGLMEENLCVRNGGHWEYKETPPGEAAKGVCTYSAIPSEGLSCASSSAGCRDYRGAASYNTSVILENNFEDGTNGNWAGGFNSNESTEPSQHSLGIPAGTQGAVTEKSIEIEAGKSYLLTFWAKEGGNLTASLENEALSLQFGGITSSADWRPYALGPLYVSQAAAYKLKFRGEKAFNLDNIKVTEILDRVFLIKDSWKTPETCDQPEKEFYLNCEEYKDRANNALYLKSFTKLCREGAVGCQALIDTKNSVSPASQSFNAVCRLDKPCLSAASCPCNYQAGEENKTVCSVTYQKQSCYFNISGVVPEKNRDKSTVITSADEIDYLVVNDAFSCKEENKGCDKFGLPQIDQDGTVLKYNDIYLANNTDDYVASQVSGAVKPILCKESENGCEEYQTQSGGLVVFKNPGDRVCQFRENVNISGELQTGWFKQGKDEPCYDDFNVKTFGDSAYDNWPGACPDNMAQCTLFLDPRGSHTDNAIEDGEFDGDWTQIIPAAANRDNSRPTKWTLTKDFLSSNSGEHYEYVGGCKRAGISCVDEEREGYGKGITGFAVKTVYRKDGSLSQKIELKPRTFYNISALIKDGGDDSPAQLVIEDCVSTANKKAGEAPGGLTSPNNSLILDQDNIHTKAVLSVPKERLSGTAYRQFGGQFYSGDSVECTAAFGASAEENDANFNGHWFDNFTVKEISQYYYLNNDSLDRQSCNGLVNEKDGCILFNDTSDPGLTFNSVATYNKSLDAEFKYKSVSPSNCKNGVNNDEYCRLNSQTVNDANTILKVTRDRACAQWLTCRSSPVAIDPITGQAKEVCSQLGLCDEIKEVGEKSQCGHWVREISAAPFTERDYQEKRDVSWAGLEYSGYSIPNMYPIQNLTAVNFGSKIKPDYRLTYAGLSCVSDDNCDKDLNGKCVKETGEESGTCVYGTGYWPEIKGDEASAVQSCRGYPEETSPFPADVSGDYFKSVNRCEVGQNCDCNYQKIGYGAGGTLIKYFTEKADPFIAVCQGGPNDGKECNGEPENYCESTKGGSCNYQQSNKIFYGWEGYCLERDLSRVAYRDEKGNTVYQCLTWLPVNQLAGGKDLFNQYREANFQTQMGKDTLHYCAASGSYGYEIKREYRNKYATSDENVDQCNNDYNLENEECSPKNGNGWYLYNGLNKPEISAGGQWDPESADNSMVSTEYDKSMNISFPKDQSFQEINKNLNENRCTKIVELQSPIAYTDRLWKNSDYSISSYKSQSGCDTYPNFGEISAMFNPNQTVILDDNQRCASFSSYSHSNGFTYSYDSGSKSVTSPPVRNSTSIDDKVCTSKNVIIPADRIKDLFVYATKKCVYDQTFDPNTGKVVSTTKSCSSLDDRLTNGKAPQIAAVEAPCDQKGVCTEGAAGKFTINDKADADIVGEGGIKDVSLKLFAWADKNQMPVRNITVDWGDGSWAGGSDGLYKNHRGLHTYADKQVACSVEEEGFGGSSDGCVESHFIFNYGYSCNSLRNIKGGDECPGAAAQSDMAIPISGCWDSKANNGRGACVFKPRIKIKDNWDWCTNDKFDCKDEEGWIKYAGRVIINSPN